MWYLIIPMSASLDVCTDKILAVGKRETILEAPILHELLGLTLRKLPYWFLRLFTKRGNQ